MLKQFEDIEIRNPLYDNFVYIYDAVLNRAIRNHRMLRITIPQGVGIANPVQWIKTGKKMEKIFLRPDEPMILYGNYVKIEKPKTEEEQLKDLAKLGVF